jgi:hypothetical protein
VDGVLKQAEGTPASEDDTHRHQGPARDERQQQFAHRPQEPANLFNVLKFLLVLRFHRSSFILKNRFLANRSNNTPINTSVNMFLSYNSK